jgi:uncharacterized protein
LSPTAFVDTSAWYALVDRRDAGHERALALFDRLDREHWSLITTNHVVAESYTLIRRRLGFEPARTFLTLAATDPGLQRIFAPQEWERAAEELLLQYPGQTLSYVDATSFVAMRRTGTGFAFAFDRDFAVAGFQLLEDS